jgi:NADH-quinone oxidoreductase subunit J
MSSLLFGYLGGAILVLSLLMVTSKNPVHSVLWMILMFFHLASLYLGLGAEFLAAIQIIVYAGAIMVLFLFVIFVLDIKTEMKSGRFSKGWPIGLLLAAGLFGLMLALTDKVLVGAKGMVTAEVLARETHTRALGKLLYTEYMFPFEVASLILLVAIVGAIVLAKKRLD